MKYLLIPFIALGIGSAAYAATDAASYPPCSKSVTDECSSAALAKHAATRHVRAHHAPAHHNMKARTETPAKS